MRFVIITGLSGAGKTQVLHSLEDHGYFCVDNLPPALMPKFAQLCLNSGGNLQKIALVVDIRGGDFLDAAEEALEELEREGYSYEILYLEADEDALVRRFKETRRRHPLAPFGRIIEGIHAEKDRLERLRGRAHHILDTTVLAPQELRRRVVDLFADEEPAARMVVHIVSFGFKHGIPLDADLVFDVRFLPNPHYVPSLRPLTGNDKPVRDYVMKWPVAVKYLEKLWELLEFLLPQYVNEGKVQLTIGIGCTGGQHRSVVLANYISERVKAARHTVVVEHRDIARRRDGRNGDQEMTSGEC